MFYGRFLKIVTIAGACIVSSAALAQAAEALVTTDLNIRTGPSTAYQRFDTIPGGSHVNVNNCLAGYNWCDVSWAGTRGWVSGNYLAYLGSSYYREPIARVGVRIGVPVVTYDFDDYNRRYYHGRYHRNHRADVRRHIRHERREHRRDVREERRERRQEAREDRRERRHDIRQERRREHRRDAREHRQERRREHRQETRQNRRHHKQETRQNRREHRQDRREQVLRELDNFQGHKSRTGN